VLCKVFQYSILRFHLLTFLPSEYITQLNAQETEDGQFQQLFTLLGEAVGTRSDTIHWQGEYLNKVALSVLELTQERLHELSAVQRRQTELLGMLHWIITKDVEGREGHSRGVAVVGVSGVFVRFKEGGEWWKISPSVLRFEGGRDRGT